MNSIKMSLIMLIGLIIFGCTKTEIRDIKLHPRDYVGKEVRIKGQVTETYSLAFMHYFQIKDNTDSIYVITSKPLPNEGEQLDIKGEVIYFTLGKTKIIAIKEN